jgi:hypothetical protein
MGRVMISIWLVAIFAVAVATGLSLIATAVYFCVISGISGDELNAWKPISMANRPLTWIVAALIFVLEITLKLPRMCLR